MKCLRTRTAVGSPAELSFPSLNEISVLGGSNFGMNTNTSYLRESECTSVPIDEDKSAYWTAVCTFAFFSWFSADQRIEPLVPVSLRLEFIRDDALIRPSWANGSMSSVSGGNVMCVLTQYLLSFACSELLLI